MAFKIIAQYGGSGEQFKRVEFIKFTSSAKNQAKLIT